MRTRRLLPLALLPLVLAVVPASAGPAETPSGTGGRATPNVIPVAHVGTVGAGVSGAFLDRNTYVLSVADAVWNEAGATVKAVTGGLQVFDVSNPEKPRKEATLSLPNYQNEDINVSATRHFAVLSQDAGSQVNLIDLTHPTKPSVLSTTKLPSGTGHTSTLVDHDRYLWVSGGTAVVVVDVRNLAAPKVLGSFDTPVGQRGPGGASGVHDAEVDRFGDITVYGGGGTAVYTLGTNPLKPTMIAQTAKADLTVERDGLIHHGGKRLDKTTWLLTEEDYSPGCNTDGAFEVWRLDAKSHLLRFVSMWDAPTGADVSGPLTQAQYCSSHWFSVNDSHIVADGWYGAGVRFLDLSDPKHPRPIGIYAGDSTTASQAIFVPGRQDLVYVADYVRGLDVVKIENGGRKAKTVGQEDLQRVGSDTVEVPGLALKFALVPSKKWGWACAQPQLLSHHSSELPLADPQGERPPWGDSGRAVSERRSRGDTPPPEPPRSAVDGRELERDAVGVLELQDGQSAEVLDAVVRDAERVQVRGGRGEVGNGEAQVIESGPVRGEAFLRHGSQPEQQARPEAVDDPAVEEREGLPGLLVSVRGDLVGHVEAEDVVVEATRTDDVGDREPDVVVAGGGEGHEELSLGRGRTTHLTTRPVTAEAALTGVALPVAVPAPTPGRCPR